MPHDPRRFVERVDFLTSPGLRSDANGIDPGAVRGRGPRCVVTSRARFDFEAGELTLNAVFEGFSPDDAVEGFNWSLPRRERVETLPPFEAAAVAIMRAEIRDPIAARK